MRLLAPVAFFVASCHPSAVQPTTPPHAASLAGPQLSAWLASGDHADCEAALHGIDPADAEATWVAMGPVLESQQDVHPDYAFARLIAARSAAELGLSSYARARLIEAARVGPLHARTIGVAMLGVELDAPRSTWVTFFDAIPTSELEATLDAAPPASHELARWAAVRSAIDRDAIATARAMLGEPQPDESLAFILLRADAAFSEQDWVRAAHDLEAASGLRSPEAEGVHMLRASLLFDRAFAEAEPAPDAPYLYGERAHALLREALSEVGAVRADGPRAGEVGDARILGLTWLDEREAARAAFRALDEETMAALHASRYVLARWARGGETVPPRTLETRITRRLQEIERQMREFPEDESCAAIARFPAAAFERRVLAAGSAPIAARDPNAADERDDALAERAMAAATERTLATLAPAVRDSLAGQYAAQDASLHALQANGMCQSLAASWFTAEYRLGNELLESLRGR